MSFQGLPVEVLQLPLPVALCVSKPRTRIVLSTAALEVLSEEELSAVLWHEYGHARWRHNQVRFALKTVSALSRFAKATRIMNSEVDRLLEESADKYALRHSSEKFLVSARAKLAG
ncbi:MAG: M56 family metallopeptidase [Micrococcales bacterium]